MASKRMLQSGLFEDDFIGSLNFFERLLWIGLFGVVADDQGRFWKNTIKIRSAIFPYDPEITDEDIMRAIEMYSQAGKLIQYEVGIKIVCQLSSWWKHQKPSWVAPSKYPALEGWTDRLKYHKGSKVVMENWDHPGGYTLPIDIPSDIPSDIPIDIPTPTVVSSKRKGVSSKSKKQEQQEPRSLREPASSPGDVVLVGSKKKPNIFTYYEGAIGPIPGNTVLIDEMKDVEKRFAAAWIKDAFTIAVKNNARNWAYVSAILRNWEAHGRDSKKDLTESNSKVIEEWIAAEGA